MTVVNIQVHVPANGSLVPAAGSMRWEPSTRRTGAGGALVLPAGFPIQLVMGAASVDLDPSTDQWSWCVTELFVGQPSRRRYLTVPATGPVNYTDLIEVDPISLEPALAVSPDPDNPGFYLIGA